MPSNDNDSSLFSRLRNALRKPKPASVVKAEGDAATAVGQQGVAISGSSFGNINTGLQLTISLFAKQAANHGPEPDKDALADKLTAYLEQLRRNYKNIPLVSYDPDDHVMRPISINAAYVPFNLAPVLEDLDAEADADLIARLARSPNGLPCDYALMLDQNLVITGDPGQGKTITLIRLAWLLAEAHLVDTTTAADSLMLSRGQLPVPVYLPLAVCAHDLKSRPLSQQSLARYLDEYTQRDGLLPADQFFSTLVEQDCPMVLLLDGLDEVVDQAERESLCEHIARLTENKRNVRVVLAVRTSAYRGKTRTQLRGSFLHFNLAPFDSTQTKQLCDRAYDALFPRISQYKQAKARSDDLQRSIAELEARRKAQYGPQAPALIDSPLMVRLAMIVHAYAGALPEHRAELLMKAVEAQLCADYAPEAGERQIVSQLAGGWETHRDLLRAAAWAMHQRQLSTLSERDVKAAMQALSDKAAYADEALRFARTRSGVLQPEGVGRYCFAHLALQQSLAACHLCATQAPGQIADFLAEQDHITTHGGREVAYLVAGYFVAPTNPDRDAARLTEFLQALAAHGQDRRHTPATRFACLDVAAQTAKDHVPKTDPLCKELAQAVAALMDDDGEAMQAGPVFARLQLGELLTEFGDPRLHITTVDAMRFCYVPPGAFCMGSDDSDPDAFDDEKCADATWHQKGFDIPYGYWLGQHPISNAQFGEFITERGYDNDEWWTLAIAAGVWQAGKLKKRYLTTRAKNDTPEAQTRAFRLLLANHNL